MEFFDKLIKSFIPANPAEVLIMIGVILFTFAIHGYSHCKAALSLGDPTAKRAGRLTLNPISHIDPMGTIFMFLFHFGWAKPVPVNPDYFPDKKKSIIMVTLSGLISNFAAAFTAGLFIRYMFLDNDIYRMILIYLVLFNTGFGLFNLIPIPPFAVSHIIEFFLSESAAIKFMKTRRYMPIALFAVILLDRFTGLNIFGRLISLPIIKISGLFGGPNLLRELGM